MTPKLNLTLLLTALFFASNIALSQNSLPNNREVDETENMMQMLLRQGVSTGQILGADAKGIPLVCGTKNNPIRKNRQQRTELPTDTRGWEVIPGVIRNNDEDTFRVELDTNGPVAQVIISNLHPQLISPESSPPFELRDDGLDGDSIAGY